MRSEERPDAGRTEQNEWDALDALERLNSREELESPIGSSSTDREDVPAPGRLMSLPQREGARRLMETAVDYRELLMMYSCAIREVRTKFEVLNTEYQVRYRRNPINFINSRLKSTASILQKLERNGLPFTTDSIRTHLHDVAGVRVVCNYLDDIYVLADALLKQDDIQLIRKKDYIASPKPNGYRSLHLIVAVPVFFAESRQMLQVEVQIRTTAQDYWAGLEHQLKYKQHPADEADLVEQLRQCAETLAQTDLQMLAIRRRLEGSQPPATPEQVLREKVLRLDVAVE